MPIIGNTFVPDADVIERLPDGRAILLWPKGRPMTLSRAYDMGLLKEPAPVHPAEVKINAAATAAAEPPQPEPEPYEPEPPGVPVTGMEAFAPEKIDATRSAVALAEEYGVDLAQVMGTGKNGRITKYDVEAVIQE